VNYNSFLTRDYKSLLETPRRPRKSRWTHLHTLLVVAVLAVISTLLILVSGDAAASRSPTETVLEPQNTTKFQKVTLPLSFPALNPENLAGEPVDGTGTEPETLPWQSVTVRRGDALAAIFKRQGLDARTLHAIMRLGRSTATLKKLRPGQVFRFQISPDGRLQTLEYEINRLESLLVSRQPEGGFEARAVQSTLDKRLAFSSGEIRSSLFEAGKQAGLTDALIMELVGVFGWDIDFAMDIRAGDRFALLYEEQYLEGEKVKDGPIVAAEFVNQGRVYRAVRYTDARGRSDYYSPDGRSMRKAFLRTPVDFRRISSRFGRRHHPTLNTMRMHKGVDYAARTGTPIKAAGDGKIVFRGRKGGYGRVIILQHGGRYSTLYAHMSRFKRGLRVGSRVRQGQIIGYVGSSGRATGPHLHYEFRVNGAHRNPLTVRLPDAAPIRKQYRQDFELKTRGLLAQLDVRTRSRIALNTP
jgi:murein DD-endopeptidase MepM/ murein hydrolase activator NlpD